MKTSHIFESLSPDELVMSNVTRLKTEPTSSPKQLESLDKPQEETTIESNGQNTVIQPTRISDISEVRQQADRGRDTVTNEVGGANQTASPSKPGDGSIGSRPTGGRIGEGADVIKNTFYIFSSHVYSP